MNREITVVGRLRLCKSPLASNVVAMRPAGIKRKKVELVNPFPIIAAIHNCVEAHQFENIELEALLLGVVDYLSIREWAWASPHPIRPNADFGEEIFGVRLLCDPRRDSGHPVPVYEPGVALELYVDVEG